MQLPVSYVTSISPFHEFTEQIVCTGIHYVIIIQNLGDDPNEQGTVKYLLGEM